MHKKAFIIFEGFFLEGNFFRFTLQTPKKCLRLYVSSVDPLRVRHVKNFDSIRRSGDNPSQGQVKKPSESVSNHFCLPFLSTHSWHGKSWHSASRIINVYPNNQLKSFQRDITQRWIFHSASLPTDLRTNGMPNVLTTFTSNKTKFFYSLSTVSHPSIVFFEYDSVLLPQNRFNFKRKIFSHNLCQQISIKAVFEELSTQKTLPLRVIAVNS